MSIQRTVQGLLADAGAGGSIGVAGFTWMSPVADAVQIVATVIACIAGVYAIRWHKLRIKLAKEKRNVESE